MGRKRFTLTLDEFFKDECSKYFPLYDYHVETEVELFNMPKRADVIVVHAEQRGPPPDFRVFDYWKTHNVISFKSLADPVRSGDLDDMLIYYLGYIRMKSKGRAPQRVKAHHGNTTATLITANPPPRSMMREIGGLAEELLPGKYVVDLHRYRIHLVDLSAIPTDGADAQFLLAHAPTERLEELAGHLLGRKKRPFADKKIIDSLRNILLLRLQAFESPELRERIMPVRMKADITDIVQPYYEQGLEKGLEQGREEGMDKGRYEGKLDAARKMIELGYPVVDVLKITGLKKIDLRKAGLLDR